MAELLSMYLERGHYIYVLLKFKSLSLFISLEIPVIVYKHRKNCIA